MQEFHLDMELTMSDNSQEVQEEADILLMSGEQEPI
jgi:hypothetical protein